MAYDEIGPGRRRYPRVPLAAQYDEPSAVTIQLDDGFVCEACRRELPLSDRSRLKDGRCRACA